MKLLRLVLIVLCPMGSVFALSAQAPTGTTGKCGDGTYTKAAHKQGACSHHSGVVEWYGTAATASKTKPADSAAAKNGATTAGVTKVWVNTPSMVYHCPGARWYGTTKKGSYMTESAANAAGARPAGGKPCS
jgi:hypothetical protein